MQFAIVNDRMTTDEPGSGPVRVGWLLDETQAGILYEPPERVRSVEMNKQHAKSASRCPAVINLESRYFVIKCPFDLHLRFVREKDGRPNLQNMLGDKSPVRQNKLHKLVHLVPEAEWRYKDRPTLQLSLPYIFVADEPVYMSQVAPFMHYRKNDLPGTIFGGRFPIDVWPRPLMWAFEWHETDKDIQLRRGEPLFYALFETIPQDRPVKVVEVARTPELDKYLNLIAGTVNYANQTFSLFKEAEKRRPSKLVVPTEDLSLIHI